MSARLSVPLMAMLAELAAMAPALADPPPWTAAHVWRDGGASPALKYPARRWRSDFGVAGGRCNSAEVGALARGIVLGGSVNPWDERPVAVVFGRVLGPVLGARIGRDADAADRGCLGHILELVPDRHPVAWSNHGLNFSVRPLPGAMRGGRLCREFDGRVRGRDIDMPIGGIACRNGRGVWLMV